MRRVMIIGQPGSGKSTLARRVGEVANLPLVHMDLLHWRPGWTPVPEAERTRAALAEHRRPAWVFEGGHSATWPDRLVHADALIWLDLPVGLRLRRVTWRSLRWLGRTRPDMPARCREYPSPEFLAYVWRTRRTGRERCRLTVVGAPARVAIHHLRTPGEVDAFERGLAPADRGGAA